MQDKQLEQAVKEIQKIKDKYDTLYREFGMMKIYAKDLEQQVKILTTKPVKNTTGARMDKMIAESKAAMERYTEKLRKEALKYAKQKQAKG